MYYCDRSKCNITNKDLGQVKQYAQENSKREKQESWGDAQRHLHEAMSYLPGLTMLTDKCPACAITEAFSAFPLIIQYSPRPPVVTVRMDGEDLYPEVVPYGGDQRESMPCVVVETSLPDCMTQTEERLRELALLELDIAELPPMPPNKLGEIKKKFAPGQSVVKHLDYLRSNAPTEEELKGAEFKEHLTQAIVSVFALKDIIRILYYYPDAIDEEHWQVLHEELVQSLENALDAEGLKQVKEVYTQPKYGNHTAELDLIFVSGLLVLMYPQMDLGNGSPEHNKEAFKKVLQECTEQTSGRLRELVDELIYIKMHQCRIPRPDGDSSFAENGRFVQMIDRYWSICKKVISYQMDHGIYAPDAILPLMTNLRKRIEVYFTELKSLDGITDAQQAFNLLLDTCTSPDFDNLQAAPEWARGEIHKIDAFLAKVNTTVKRREYTLTDEERIFIEQANRELDEFHAFLNKKWKEMLVNAETIGKQIVPKADAKQSSLGEKDLGKFVIARKEINEEVHWIVNGTDNGKYYVRPDVKKAKIIEVLFNQIGLGWVPHKTFMNTCAWNNDEYFPSLGNPGCMQRQLTDIRNFLKVQIEFSRDKGVRFAENVVKSRE